MIKGLGHIGICVSDNKKAEEFFTKLLDAKLCSVVDYPDMGQKSAYYSLADGTMIEVMTPTREGGVVDKFLKKHGEGFHHISLKTDDIKETVIKLEDSSCRIVSGGEDFAFLHPSSGLGVLYELYQVSRKES